MSSNEAEKTRPIMDGFSTGMTVLFYVLAGISILIFLYGVVAPFLRYRRGDRTGLPSAREVPRRVLTGLKLLATHQTIARRNPAVGWAHRGIVYGWVALLIGTTIVFIDKDIVHPIFGVHIFKGDFYLITKAFLNVLGTALVAGLIYMMIRRAAIKPSALDYTRPDRAPGEAGNDRSGYRGADWIFVWSLLVIAVTGFILQGVRMAKDDAGYRAVQFGGWVFAKPLDAVLDQRQLEQLHSGLWWFHGILALAFIAAIPYTKAAHMLTSFASMVLRDPEAIRRLRPTTTDQQDKPIGYATLADISALHLLHLDACTKCGRCNDVCPAMATGRPLAPRDVVLELRDEVHAAAPVVGGVLGLLMRGDDAPGMNAPVIGHDRVREETVWSCMQCNACVDVCPVGIEQAPIIAGLRRALVEDGDIAPTLQTAFESIATTGNSFGREAGTRADWTKSLGFTIKDARSEPVDVLWFVGDYASFDERSQEITTITARLFHDAGLDFGILYEAEVNSGNDVRRAGEEGLFEELARQNIAALRAASFRRIVTTDPHSLNALRNDYPDFGGEAWDVVHHTQQLVELMEDGRLSIAPLDDRRVTYHDPCHLGRMNGDYDAPRRIIELLGCTLVEMPRNRSNSFCCGAGGGRIWLPDPPGTKRPSEDRIDEATSLEGVDLFVVSCPKDVTMYEDAIRATGNSNRLLLQELTEMIAEAHARAAHPAVLA